MVFLVSSRRSGDPQRGPSNQGLGTKDTQSIYTHIPLAVQYQVVRTDESPLHLQQALGGGGIAYMAIVNKRQHIGDGQDIGEITSTQRLIGKAQLGRSEPQLWISWRRKQWFLRSSNNPRRAVQDIAVGPQGRYYVRTWQIGVFHPTEVAYRVFPPLNCRGFLPVNTQVFPPVTEQSAQAIQDPYQTLIKELLLLLSEYMDRNIQTEVIWFYITDQSPLW